MPYQSKKQQRWAHSPAGKEALTDEEIDEFDHSTNYDTLPEEAQAGKGPTRTQGPGKSSDRSRTIRRMSREQNKGMPTGGPQTTKKGDKGYTRKQKHKDVSESEELTEIDETYRGLGYPIASIAADMNWETPAVGRPCGEGEDPERGHCNPNSPGGGSLKDAQQQQEQQLGRPMDVGEFMSFKKQWEAENPEGAQQQQQQQNQRRLEILDQEKEEKRQSRRDYKQAERGDFGLREGQQIVPQVDPEPSGYNVGPTEEKRIEYDKGVGPNRLEAPRTMRSNIAEEDDDETPVVDTPGFPPTKEGGGNVPDKGAAWGSAIAADLNWSTHKSETFNDPGKDGCHPAWGLKSIIDRGVKPHEKPSGDKRIGEAEHQTTKRNIGGKKFKSFSHVLDWS